MGWSSTIATCYSAGLVDRLRECHNLNTYEETEMYSGRVVLAETLRGSTYHAFVWVTNTKKEKCYVFPVTMLTAIKGCEFSYKDITSYDFPSMYLKELPNTISNASFKENCLIAALENKETNKEKAEKKKLLADLAYGSEIEFFKRDKKYHLKKQPPNHQFKTAWWLVMDIEKPQYMQKKYIPIDYTVVKDNGRLHA